MVRNFAQLENSYASVTPPAGRTPAESRPASVRVQERLSCISRSTLRRETTVPVMWDACPSAPLEVLIHPVNDGHVGLTQVSRVTIRRLSGEG